MYNKGVVPIVWPLAEPQQTTHKTKICLKILVNSCIQKCLLRSPSFVMYSNALYCFHMPAYCTPHQPAWILSTCLTAKEPPELCEKSFCGSYWKHTRTIGIAWARVKTEIPLSRIPNPIPDPSFLLNHNPNIYLLTLFALIRSSRIAYAVKILLYMCSLCTRPLNVVLFYRYVSWMVK